MAESLIKLRQRAKRLGMTGTRGAGRDEVLAFLADGGGDVKPKPKKKRPTPAPAKKRTTAKRRAPGRPAKRTPQKRTPTRKPATGTRKRQSTDNGGRNPIDTGALDFSAEGFNPRAGGDRELIFKAVKKARGNREKAFAALLANISRLVPSKKKNGEKRSKSEKESYLKYLINRVIFDFAVATGQHAASKNRAEYGTGGTGAGIFKRGRKPTKRTTTRTPAKRTQTRKPAAKRKPATGTRGTRKGRRRTK